MADEQQAAEQKAEQAPEAGVVRPPAAPGGSERPTREEVEGWIGARLDEISGAGIGKIEDAYIDEDSGLPEWILIKVGRFGHHTVVPARQSVAGAGHVWVPWDRSSIRRCPRVEPGGALTATEELLLCEHYGIVEGVGRAAELADKPADQTTVVPLSG